MRIDQSAIAAIVVRRLASARETRLLIDQTRELIGESRALIAGLDDERPAVVTSPEKSSPGST